ncbi:MAG TPA: FAD-binding and (Fe-S)-binding domain-containing protein [Solirubrobacteraceae bacterium]
MALLAPDVRRIAPSPAAPAPDRVPDRFAAGTPEPLRSQLIAALGADRVLTRVSDLVRYASDGSPYRLLPQAIVMARDVADVAAALRFGREHGIGVTLRAAGTSLNGQAQGDGLLVDVRRHWIGVTVEDGGARARVRPGTILGQANAALAPYGRKLGPDPASTDAATVGGVIANNSGGMRCGVVHDSYQTVRSLTFVLPSGTVVDTAAPDAEERFAAAEPALARGLEEIRDELRADAGLAERIRSKFRIKNTTGYRLVAFLDADTPVEILRRLLVGSEGTLAFIAEAVFETVALPRRTTVSWLHFRDVDAASEIVPDLVATGATAVELMGAPALMVASHSIPGTPEHWRELAPDSAALLVELAADDDAGLDAALERAGTVLERCELLREAAFTRDPEEVELAWRVREGMFGLVGKLRPAGTSLITEDVCVPPERIAESVKDVQALLAEHGFLPGVAGHASAGNLHFMLTPAFGTAGELERYEAFMGDLVELIVGKYDGSLKAEHGTGRNMAPFVEREWGAKATELMWRVKALADPDGVLGPGVVLNRDPGVHVRDLKSTPAIEDVITTCVECGFCEPVCPSRWLTTTPRQRIVLRREMARQGAGSPVLAALLAEYEYDGLQTCAADGSCGLACPLGIDTGKAVKDYRHRERTARAERVALRLAQRFAAVERGARAGLRAGHLAGDRAMGGVTGALRRVVSDELLPRWPEGMPPPGPAHLPATRREGAAAVYFPACINRIFGYDRALSAPEALVTVSARAGAPLWIPGDVRGRCCATPWHSKGYRDGASHMANATLEAMWRWSDEGALPIVVDATSCTQGIVDDMAGSLTEANRERHARLEILDAVAWARDRLLPRLTVRRRAGTVAVHPTCASRHLRLHEQLAQLMGALADDVFVPAAASCCGFAGDRGLLHPELTAAATRDEAAELREHRADRYLSSNRTCELGLQQATGAPYESFVFLLEEATRP